MFMERSGEVEVGELGVVLGSLGACIGSGPGDVVLGLVVVLGDVNRRMDIVDEVSSVSKKL